ncbi:MAG: hypothetical protein ACD_58C00282G0001 [uncultured bacterium]|nr:MAG: hypothetical protein ACD_58C00282G0001 [uncultured bacterium]
MSLYRKHRPQKFADIVGQEHIKKVLTNSIAQGKIGHAYLFSGPRGTGKTTMARLLAKALNCKTNLKSEIENRKSDEYEPCNECISCVEITGDRSMDVIEIDAASNRGIDEIRELRDKVRYAPSNSAYKIYIIDEVHMLTKEAFNALLKTLEEPPAHAVFIMATTELHKIPDTILSRTQQFDFKRASFKELIDNLLTIAQKEKFKINPDAVELIARAGDGSFRDSLSILDQIASLNEKEIQLGHVKEILGLVPQNLLDEFIVMLEKNDVSGAIDLIDQIYSEGYDLAQFNQTVIEALRDKMVKNSDYNLLKIIKKFIEAGQDMKYAQIPQIPMELAVVESCNMEHITCNKGTKEHKNIETNKQDQEAKIKDQSDNSKIKSENKSEIPTSPEVDSITATDEEPKADDQILNLKSKIINLQEKWPEVVGAVLANNQSLGTLLKDAKALEIKDNKIIIGVKFKFYAERIMASDKIVIIVEAIEKVIGTKMGVECVVEEKLKTKSEKLKTNDENVINDNLVADAMEVFGE